MVRVLAFLWSWNVMSLAVSFVPLVSSLQMSFLWMDRRPLFPGLKLHRALALYYLYVLSKNRKRSQYANSVRYERRVNPPPPKKKNKQIFYQMHFTALWSVCWQLSAQQIKNTDNQPHKKLLSAKQTVLSKVLHHTPYCCTNINSHPSVLTSNYIHVAN